MDRPPACPSCGAALAPGADRCDLCGTPTTGEPALEATAASPLAVADAPLDAPGIAAVACASCGHRNPVGARFCNQCGAPLAAPASAPASPSEPARPPSDVGRRALTLVGVGIAAVVGLYAISALSERSPAAPAEGTSESGAAEVGPAAPVPEGPPPALPAEQQAEADRLEAAGTAESLYEAGRYYLTAAFVNRESNPQASAQWARRAVADFEQSLALSDQDHVRLAVAEASRFDPSAPPMRPIEEVQTILARNPTHVGATYMQGDLRLMRAEFQPEWRDSARVSFERVLALAAPDDPIRQQAEERLAAIAADVGG